jgi:putative transcriptional regulator
MNKAMFRDLLKSVEHLGAHKRGARVPGARVLPAPAGDVRAMRRCAGVSQAQFARLIGVPVRTVQNWEQGRTRPAGPARALLKIVAADPKAAIKALHA